MCATERDGHPSWRYGGTILVRNPIRLFVLFLLCLVSVALPSCAPGADRLPVQRQVTINADVDGARVDPVNVWPAPADRSRALAQLRHGETVGLLSTQGDYAYIRTAGGAEGWLQKDFIAELR